MNERVLVLGGGVGGVVVARRLRSELPADREVVLIDRDADHLFQPSLLWMLTGERRLEEIRRPIDALRGKGIQVRRAEIEAIDPEATAVRADGDRLEGDALVVALGAKLRPDLVPGLEDAGHNLYSAGGVRDFRTALRDHRGGRIVVLTAEPGPGGGTGGRSSTRSTGSGAGSENRAVRHSLTHERRGPITP